jgi:hypothetical protein
VGASEVHDSNHENCNIIIELKFNKQFPEAITFLLYNVNDNLVLVDFARKITTVFYERDGHHADTVYTA